MKVISNHKIALDTYELIIDASMLENVDAGQFMHLKTGREDLILRRPISIASYNDKGEMSLVYKVLGEGTLAMTKFKENDTVDALGPLGQGFETSDHTTALIVGGGMGVAPLYQLGKELVKNGTDVKFVLGFGSKEMIYYQEKFEALGEVIITTDDGSEGIKGNVSIVLDDIEEYDAIFACGPLPLLHYLTKKYETHPKLFISLEERMACGIGACYACDTKDKKHRVCHDGPVFNANEVEI